MTQPTKPHTNSVATVAMKRPGMAWQCSYASPVSARFSQKTASLTFCESKPPRTKDRMALDSNVKPNAM